MTVYNKLAFQNGTLLDEAEQPGSCDERRAELHQPHVKPLEQWARHIAKQRDEQVPSFDPRSAGIEARALFLLQDPSKAAAYGSRFISIDNNDQTAHNCRKAYAETGLDYKQAMHWNVVPWWVADPAKKHVADPRRTLAAQAKRARPDLVDLVRMLDQLEVVVLLGKHAQRAWAMADISLEGVTVIGCPHPSPLAWNKVDQGSGLKNGDLTIQTFGRVAAMLG